MDLVISGKYSFSVETFVTIFTTELDRSVTTNHQKGDLSHPLQSQLAFEEFQLKLILAPKFEFPQ